MLRRMFVVGKNIALRPNSLTKLVFFFIFPSTFFCISVISGLPTAGKPPPLNMVSPVAKIQRTTATVPPMNQVSPSSSITSVNSNNAMSATRASSFAAALRKLAKQAGDPPGKKQGLVFNFQPTSDIFIMKY